MADQMKFTYDINAELEDILGGEKQQAPAKSQSI